MRNESDGVKEEGYAFEFALAPEFLSLDVRCTGDATQSLGSYWSQAKPSGDTGWQLEQYYSGGLPNGKVTCEIPMMHFQQHGEWKAEWQVPSAAE